MALLTATTTGVAATDGASLKTLIETTAAAGDRVYIPRQAVGYTPSTAITISKQLEIFGDGMSTLLNTTGARNFFTIDNTVNVQGLYIHDLGFVGSGGALVAIERTATPGVAGDAGLGDGKKLFDSRFQRLGCSGFVNAIRLIGHDLSTGALVHNTVSDCDFTTLGGVGVYFHNATMHRLERTEINNCQTSGFWAIICPLLSIYNCAVETNNLAFGSADEGNSQVLVKLSHGFTILGLDIEGIPSNAAANKNGLCISNTNGGTVLGLSASSLVLSPDSAAVKIVLGSKGIFIGPIVASLLANEILEQDTITNGHYSFSSINRADAGSTRFRS